MEDTLSNVKLLLGLADDTTADEVLKYIISATESRLKLYLGGAEEIPEELGYIVSDVAVTRYNRIGSEGLSSHSVDGESLTYSDNDFSAYMADIEAYLDSQEQAKRGRIRFI